ncbi:MAG: hypothetical protein IPM29_00685 [Planctomycetes bacterium]|nr:hypothetical protein [Planctomycetota bacterium]
MTRPPRPQVGGSRFRIQPDPPVAGQPLTVTYVGPAREVEWQVDGGAAHRVQPDANGRFRIDPVPTGDEIMFSDNLGVPGYLHREILEVD